MARVTVEDCIEKIPNRFDLVMLASHRARSLSSGIELTVERDNDKNPVVALREIAEETINLADVEESLIKGLQKHLEPDAPDDEEMDLLTAGDDFMTATADMKPDLSKSGDSDEDRPRFNDDVSDSEAGYGDAPED